jgi:Putative prokaryotic signal transducing protein
MPKEDDIITFETYYDPMLAQIIRGKLEANGIHCFIADDGMIGVNPLYNQAIGGVKIKIFERDLEKCRAIVAEDYSLVTEEETISDAEDDAVTICPYCGSNNVRYGPATKKKFSWYSIIISFLFFIYPLPDRNAWHCFSCGKDFE